MRPLDPYRNCKQDIADALEYARESFDDWPEDPDLDIKLAVWSIPKILKFDDYGSWGEWRAGELRDLSADDLEAELRSYRRQAWATKALRWADEGVPAIVIIDSRYGLGIADGRGRVSYAVGMALPNLHVIQMFDRKSGA